MTNKLYYGDNLQVLRDSIADESVDLIYLDPPFNSNASYNVLFKGPQPKRTGVVRASLVSNKRWRAGQEIPTCERSHKMNDRQRDALFRTIIRTTAATPKCAFQILEEIAGSMDRREVPTSPKRQPENAYPEAASFEQVP